jgi:two-component system, chemotaxis family, protein-glutamate methylesterase/glutaminase
VEPQRRETPNAFQDDSRIRWVTSSTQGTPDVVITDLVMPRMDGLTFLRKILADGPLPVVVCSEVAHRRTEDAISALELGAVEVITKPKLGVRDFLHESAVMLIDVVHSAAQAELSPARFLPVAPRNTADVILPFSPAPPQQPSGDKVIAIGASTPAAPKLFVNSSRPCPSAAPESLLSSTCRKSSREPSPTA